MTLKVNNSQYNRHVKRGSLILSSLLVLTLFMIPASATIIQIDSCQTLSGDGNTYILNKSVTSAGVCFTISANNITLTSNSTLNQINGTTAGVSINVFYNFTGNNLNITSPGGTGVRMLGSSNFNNITGNIISSSNGYGVTIIGSLNNITGNIISTSSGSGVLLTASSWKNNITGNTINTTGGYSIKTTTSSYFTNITGNIINTTEYGIYLSITNNNTLKDNSVSATGNFATVYLDTGTYNNITNNTISISGGSGHSIDLVNSNNNSLTNNIFYADNASVVFTASSSNNLTNNTISTGGGYPIYFLSSINNRIVNGSIRNILPSSSYYLNNVLNHSFINTNFTTRYIEFADSTSWFNYSNNQGITYISNNISVAKTLIRTLINWSQTDIVFSDNININTATSYYNVSGLTPSTIYDIYENGLLTSSIPTNAGGELPQLTIGLTTTPKTIRITLATFIYIRVFDEQQTNFSISNFTAQIYTTTTLLNKSTVNGWINFSSSEVSSGEYLIRIVPNSSFSPRSQLATSPANVTFYVPSTSAPNTIDSVAFYLYDFIGLFPWQTTKFYIYKNGSLMFSSYFDTEAKVMVSLIQGDTYTVSVVNGVNLWNAGSFVPIQTGSVKIAINDYGVNQTKYLPFNYNLTWSNTDIILKWAAASNSLNSINFTIYKGTAKTQVHQLISGIINGISDYPVTNTSDIYYVYITANSTNNANAQYVQVIDYRAGNRNVLSSTIPGVKWEYGTFVMPNWGYDAVSFTLIGLVGGTFGAYSSAIGAPITVLFALILAYFGWIPGFSPGIPVLGGLLFYSILYFMKHKEKEG